MVVITMAKKKVGRPPTSPRDDTSVKFDRALAFKAKIITTIRRITIAEYVSEAARATIERDYEMETSKLNQGGANQETRG